MGSGGHAAAISQREPEGVLWASRTAADLGSSQTGKSNPFGQRRQDDDHLDRFCRVAHGNAYLPSPQETEKVAEKETLTGAGKPAAGQPPQIYALLFPVWQTAARWHPGHRNSVSSWKSRTSRWASPLVLA